MDGLSTRPFYNAYRPNDAVKVAKMSSTDTDDVIIGYLMRDLHRYVVYCNLIMHRTKGVKVTKTYRCDDLVTAADIDASYEHYKSMKTKDSDINRLRAIFKLKAHNTELFAQLVQDAHHSYKVLSDEMGIQAYELTKRLKAELCILQPAFFGHA